MFHSKLYVTLTLLIKNYSDFVIDASFYFRFFLIGLVALNVYLERLICKTVLENEDHGFQQMVRLLHNTDMGCVV